MKKAFQGHLDNQAVILENVFPSSDLVFSTPIQFDDKRSKVFIEGSADHLDLLFDYLEALTECYIDEKFFGKWLYVERSEVLPGIIVCYKAIRGDLDKMQLLSLVLRKHLAEVCDLHLSRYSNLIVRPKYGGEQKSLIRLPEGFFNGRIILGIEDLSKEAIFIA